jgi:hypothetical protein
MEGSVKYDLSWYDFKKAAIGSLYTFFGVVGTLLLPFAESLKAGTIDWYVLLFALASAFVSALGNLLIRFFRDTTN